MHKLGVCFVYYKYLSITMASIIRHKILIHSTIVWFTVYFFFKSNRKITENSICPFISISIYVKIWQLVSYRFKSLEMLKNLKKLMKIKRSDFELLMSLWNDLVNYFYPNWRLTFLMSIWLWQHRTYIRLFYLSRN